jgi:4-hydroxy-3-polyprenylbenzoate decarboxylase
MSAKLPIALGITGASGAPYWRRLVEVLLQAGHEVHVTHSANADSVCRAELGESLEQQFEEVRASATGHGELRVFEKNDFYAPMASGTAPYLGMAVTPCSMGTLARIAQGASGDLMTRAADVMLKERRKLVLLCRETPVSLIHLENMTRVTRAGAVVIPASPGFYYRPRTIADLVDFVVQRVCDQLGVEVRLVKKWGSPES